MLFYVLLTSDLQVGVTMLCKQNMSSLWILLTILCLSLPIKGMYSCGDKLQCNCENNTEIICRGISIKTPPRFTHSQYMVTKSLYLVKTALKSLEGLNLNKFILLKNLYVYGNVFLVNCKYQMQYARKQLPHTSLRTDCLEIDITTWIYNTTSETNETTTNIYNSFSTSINQTDTVILSTVGLNENEYNLGWVYATIAAVLFCIILIAITMIACLLKRYKLKKTDDLTQLIPNNPIYRPTTMRLNHNIAGDL